MSFLTIMPEFLFQKACNSLWIMNRFFAVAEVTWMFNEGVYLLKTIIFVFSQNSYIWAFFLFGWGKSNAKLFESLVVFLIKLRVDQSLMDGNKLRSKVKWVGVKNISNIWLICLAGAILRRKELKILSYNYQGILQFLW